MAKKIALDENTKILAITGAIAFSTFILCSTIHNLYADKIRGLRLKINGEERNLVARKDISKIDGLINAYRTYIYKDIPNIILRDTISVLAREIGVDIVSMQPTESESFVNYTKISFKLKLNCTYNQLGRFIERLEMLNKMTKIDEIVIAEGRDYNKAIDITETATPQGREVQIEVSLTISTYRLKS